MTLHIGPMGGNIREAHARPALAVPGVEISAIHGTNAEKIAHLRSEHGGITYQHFGGFLQHRPCNL